MWLRSRSALTSLIVIALLVLAAAPAAADEASDAANLGIKPVGIDEPFFTLQGQPGETIDLEVEITNYGTAPVAIMTYAADAYSLVNGGFGVRLSDEPIGGTTTWVEYPGETFELDGQTATTRSVKVTIPKDARPGEYLTALVVQNAVATGGTGQGVGFKQINRQAIAIAIELPGELVPGLALGAVSHKFASQNSVLLVEVENTGNTHMSLAGDASIFGPDGAQVLARPVAMQTVYAGTSTTLEIPVGSPLEQGDYSLSLELGNSELQIVESLALAPISVPLAPDAPVEIAPAPESESADVPAPAAAEVAAPEPADAPAPATEQQPVETPVTEQGGFPAWMLVAGVVAALILGAGGAVTAVYLLRRRERAGIEVASVSSPAEMPPAKPVASHPAVSGGSGTNDANTPDAAPEPAIMEPVSSRPVVPVVRRRSASTSVTRLLDLTRAARDAKSGTGWPNSGEGQG